MNNSRHLHIKIERKRIAVIEEDYSTQKLLSETINTFFDDLEACTYESLTEFDTSTLGLDKNKICSTFVSLNTLKTLFNTDNNFNDETLRFLKNTPAIIMSHTFNEGDLEFLNNFFNEEPIILKKPIKVKDVISLTEWTRSKSKKKKEVVYGLQKHTGVNSSTFL